MSLRSALEFDNDFCTTCGLRCDQVPCDRYDGRTGEQITRAVCPTRHCYHTGVDHIFPPFKIFRFRRCVDCGTLKMNTGGSYD